MMYHQTIITTISAIFGITYMFPVYVCGFRFYVIYNANTQRTMMSKIKWSTKTDENHSSVGYFIGYFCAGHYNEKENILKIFCTEKTFEELTKRPSVETEEHKKEDQQYIQVFYKNTSVQYVYYKSRSFNVTPFQILPKQERAVKSILAQYESSVNKSVVCMLHGKPNTGKSMVSLLIAKQLKANYCKTYKPIDPGDSFETIYNTCNPTADKPLVILLDEFDILLEKIHKDLVKPNTHVLSEVTDKISWNQLLDNLSIGFYPFTVVILTSNISPERIAKLYDPSCIRENRCQLIMELK